MPKKKAPEESFAGKAKRTLSRISDALNPEKKLRGAADRAMKGASRTYGGRARRDRLDEVLERSGAGKANKGGKKS